VKDQEKVERGLKIKEAVQCTKCCLIERERERERERRLCSEWGLGLGKGQKGEQYETSGLLAPLMRS
jgi:hypothetical protein